MLQSPEAYFDAQTPEADLLQPYLDEVRAAVDNERYGVRHWQGADKAIHVSLTDTMAILRCLRADHVALYTFGVRGRFSIHIPDLTPGLTVAGDELSPHGLRMTADDTARFLRRVDAWQLFGGQGVWDPEARTWETQYRTEADREAAGTFLRSEGVILEIPQE